MPPTGQCNHFRSEVNDETVVEGVAVGPDGGEAVLAGGFGVVPGDFCGHVVLVDHDVLGDRHPVGGDDDDAVFSLEGGLEVALRLTLTGVIAVPVEHHGIGTHHLLGHGHVDRGREARDEATVVVGDAVVVVPVVVGDAVVVVVDHATLVGGGGIVAARHHKGERKGEGSEESVAKELSGRHGVLQPCGGMGLGSDSLDMRGNRAQRFASLVRL